MVSFSIRQVISVAVEVWTLHLDWDASSAIKATDTYLVSRGKPEPSIVKISPPRALKDVGVSEVTSKSITISATPA